MCQQYYFANTFNKTDIANFKPELTEVSIIHLEN